jgi:pimeloyl-ACP methyl ester carboxylesterase
VKKKIFHYLVAAFALMIGWQVSRSFFIDEERHIRSQIRSQFEQKFATEIEDAKKRFGLHPFSLQAAQSNQPSAIESKNVILIHGLDDPGKVWMNLAPVVARNNHNVWIMTYPNDQPIRDSAFFFNEQLIQLKNTGVDEVFIVAHSMGGLVTREVLTNPETRCSTTSCKRTHIKQLIMVGTPNHGSEMARFRELAEFREQASRLFEGQAGWLDWIADGAGEAGLDLMPGSSFLQELNQRPLPVDTEFFIIAGVIAEQDNIGDALVSLDSAKLEDIPFTVVEGNHLSIVRNISEMSQRIPPAIPIISELLDH